MRVKIGCNRLVSSFDSSSENRKSVLDIFVPSIYLVDIVYRACAFGTKGGYQQGYACTYIGRGHIVGAIPL